MLFDDGFNERSNYINNAVDKNKLQKMGPSNVDSSFAQMNVNSHKNDATRETFEFSVETQWRTE